MGDDRDDSDSFDTNSTQKDGLLYSVDETPPWYLCIVLGFQQFLTAAAIIGFPAVAAPALCIPKNDIAHGQLVGTVLFGSGMATLLQTLVGIRLPIVQGVAIAFLVPTLGILNLPKWKCPDMDEFQRNLTSLNESERMTAVQELWKPRIREIQGALITASMFQVAIGAFGVIGFLLRFIGPLTIAPTTGLIGLSLFPVAARYSAGMWGIAVLTLILIVGFSQYMARVRCPCHSIRRNEEGRVTCIREGSVPFFRLFSVILSVLLTWLLCHVLTITDVFSSVPGESGHLARTDSASELMANSAWFRFPYPFQWGMPTFSVASTFGMLSGVLAGILESVGDYYVCSRMAGAAIPPEHAINRGVLMEGIGCVLLGIWGSGSGTTSYSQNIGAIAITRVGSRNVVVTTGTLLLLLGMMGKLGAFFAAIPMPVFGGLFVVMFGMITANGISTLRFVDLTSGRNLFIIGFTFFFGLTLPSWLNTNPGAIRTGSNTADQILTVLLGSSMFIGGTLGFLLDNTIPGTSEERGMKRWHARLIKEQSHGAATSSEYEYSTYDLPLCGRQIFAQKWTRYIPVCPTFDSSLRCKRLCSCCSSEETFSTHL